MGERQKTEATEQILLRLPKWLIKRLEQGAETAVGRKTRNMVGAEIIEQYIEFWEYKERTARRVYDQQRSSVFETGEQPLVMARERGISEKGVKDKLPTRNGKRGTNNS